MEEDGKNGQPPLHGRNNDGHAGNRSKRLQNPRPDPGDRPSEQGRVEKIPDVAVFFLEDAERAVVGWKLVDRRGNKGYQGSDPHDERRGRCET